MATRRCYGRIRKPGRAKNIAENAPSATHLTIPGSAAVDVIDVFGFFMETAEMSKLFENCFRLVNIAYANEIADACQAHGIDPHEMVRACATKPYGFMPFTPGLGAGGPCIPVNPRCGYDVVAFEPKPVHIAMLKASLLAFPFMRTCSPQQHARYHRAEYTAHWTV